MSNRIGDQPGSRILLRVHLGPATQNRRQNHVFRSHLRDSTVWVASLDADPGKLLTTFGRMDWSQSSVSWASTVAQMSWNSISCESDNGSNIVDRTVSAWLGAASTS